MASPETTASSATDMAPSAAVTTSPATTLVPQLQETEFASPADGATSPRAVAASSAAATPLRPPSTSAPVPNEMLLRIFSYVDDFGTLKSARLAGRCLEAIAAEFLFKEVYIMFLPESMAKLDHISTTPAFARHVERIILMGDIIDPDWELISYEGFREFRSHEMVVKSCPDSHDDGPMSSDDERVELWDAKHWRELKSIRAEQEQFFQNGDAQRSLATALASLPRLRSMELRWWQEPNGPENGPEFIPIISNLTSRLLLEPQDLFFDEAMERHDSESEEFWGPPCALTTLFRALGTSEHRLTELSIEHVPRLQWLEGGDSLREMLNSDNYIPLALERLETLHVTLDIGSSFGEATYDLIAQFFGSAPNLKDLGILTHWGYWSPQYAPISGILDMLQLRNLKNFRLGSGCASERAMTSFMQRHASTLETFETSTLILETPPGAISTTVAQSQNNGASKSEEEMTIYELALQIPSSWDNVIRNTPLMPNIKRIHIGEVMDKQIEALRTLDRNRYKGAPLYQILDRNRDKGAFRYLHAFDISQFMLSIAMGRTDTRYENFHSLLPRFGGLELKKYAIMREEAMSPERRNQERAQMSRWLTEDIDI